jgi:hypothetical protein
MKLDIARMDIWAASIKDCPGTVAEKLEGLTASGASLEFLLARRAPEKPDTGVIFASPIKGPKQIKAAKKAGFHKSKSICGVRVATTDKKGLGAILTLQLAQAGINLRGLSAGTTGRRAVIHMAFDSSADAGKAIRLLKKL